MRPEHFLSRRTFVGGAALLSAGIAVPLASRASDHEGDAAPAASPMASPQASPAAGVTVVMTPELTFDPVELVIPAGTTVTWTNDSAMPHTATGDQAENPLAETNPEYVTLPDGAEPWGSELMQPGDTYAHTFEVPGEYHYICIPHVMAGMRGTIVVEA